MASTASVQPLPFGTLLKRYRRAAGLSQEALAERAGYSVGHISKLERSARLPTPATADLLADALALDASNRATLRRTLQHQPSSRHVVSLHPGAPSPPTSPPLVNRAHELADLEQHLAGHGRPVLLFAGEPGIGKTRLLQEAVEQGRNLGWCVLEGGNRCHWRERFYAPVLGALETYVHSQPPARLRSSLQGCMWLVRLLPELADIAGVPMPTWTLPAEQERQLLISAVERFLINVAGPAGTLLVLDDLQWADADGIDLLGTLALAHGERPLRIVGAYRNTDVSPDSHLAVLLADLARQRLIKHVVLGLLAPEAAAELLDALLEGEEQGPDGNVLREDLLSKAGGAPFYIACFAEGLQTGALDRVNGEDGVPWDIAQTIRQRMAMLSECAQRIIQIAAVAGRRPSRSLLVRVATLSGREEAEALAGLDAACRARLLMAEADDTFAFAHNLIQEVVESDLGTVQRTQLHLEVARALESEVAANDRAPLQEEVAEHYTRAGDSEKALPYLRLVAVREEAVHANAAAAAHYRALAEQLDALGHTAEATSAREHLGMALLQLGQYDPALAALEQAAEAYRRAGDCEGAGRAVALIGFVHCNRGTIDEGIVRLQQELLGVVQHSPRGSAALYVGVAHLYYLRGLYTDDLDAAERAAERARVVEDRSLLAMAAYERSSALDLLGNLTDSLEVLESTAIPLLRATADTWTLAHALTRAGSVHLMQGEFGAAARYAEDALAVAERLDDAELTAYMLFGRARIAFYAGDWDRALADTERAARVGRQGRPTWWSPTVLIGLGELRLRKGQVEQGSTDIGEGLALGERSGYLDATRRARGLLAERDLMEGRAEQARARLEPLLDRSGKQERTVTGLLPLLAQACLKLGDVGRAQVLAASSVARADAAGLRLVLPEALRAQAQVALRERHWDVARDTLEHALSLSRAMGYRYAEARGLYVSGLLHQQKGEPEQAVERLMAALAILNQLGERFYAEHVERALAETEPT